MKLYPRELYLRKIRGFYHDTGMIKVITGVRRCGKSCLMRTIAEELAANGIPEENILFIDLKSFAHKSVTTASALEAVINDGTSKEGTTYLFIDEIQNAKGFESVIEAYRAQGRHSIFITGSNSYLLSGELTTWLTGRYLQFEMFTLTFEEYEGMKAFYGLQRNPSKVAEMDAYIMEGGFPKALEYESLRDKRKYVSDIVAEIFEKDIMRRVRIKNEEAFGKIQTYIINNFGSSTSLSNMLSDLTRAGLKIKRETLRKYIRVLEDAKIIYECKRFDLKSRNSVNGETKYYLSDLSFYFAKNTDNRINYGPVLENIVFQYAKSHDYEVSVGRIGKLECDFIMRDPEANYSYAQVAMTVMNSIETENREYAPLEKIHDGYPKYLLTRDDLPQRRGGIKHRNIPEMFARGELFS